MAFYAYNAAAQEVDVGGTVALSTALRCGCESVLDGGGVRLNVPGGWYRVDVSATVTAADPGDVTLTARVDGTDVPGATATATVAVAGDFAALPLTFLTRAAGCCGSRPVVTLVNAGAAATYDNVAVTVTRVG